MPEIEPNISISFIAFKTSSLLLQNRVVSSASCEILILWFYSSNLTVIPFISLQLLKSRAMISTDKINNKADKGHLWRIPREFLQFSDTQPLFITHVCISLYSVLTQLIKDSLNFIKIRIVYDILNLSQVKTDESVFHVTSLIFINNFW